MESNIHQDDELLARLFAVSGSIDRVPRPEDYFQVSVALHHLREDVRERAIFIGGLLWMDPTILGYFRAALEWGGEDCDQNRRLMVECLVSAWLEAGRGQSALESFLQHVLATSSPTSYAAKAAFVGIRRLSGELTKQQFAALDYDDIDLNRSGLP